MNKIASPQQLQQELQFLITACTHGGSPSREKVAARLNELADRVAANTPEQIASMLGKKLRGAKAFYDQLKDVDYPAYNIGDFFRDDLPKARTLSDRIMKQKKALEVTLSGFIRQVDKDLKDAKRGR